MFFVAVDVNHLLRVVRSAILLNASASFLSFAHPASDRLLSQICSDKLNARAVTRLLLAISASVLSRRSSFCSPETNIKLVNGSFHHFFCPGFSTVSVDGIIAKHVVSVVVLFSLTVLGFLRTVVRAVLRGNFYDISFIAINQKTKGIYALFFCL